MRPVVLFRPVDMDAAEYIASATYFPTFRERTAIQKHDLVVARYSALPFYEDLQADVDYVGARLINTHRQHLYIADMRNWVEDLADVTPKTWYRLEDIDDDGPYILKGRTNSRKGDWKTHCFAKDRKAATDVYWRLATDGVIGGGHQDIYIRKFVPLKTYFKGINDIPVTKEFRFFTIFGDVLCGSYYWANYAEDLVEVPKAQPYHHEFVRQIASRIVTKTNFVVIDIAETEDGRLVLIELNDGQMSGLSLNDPSELYRNLSAAIAKKGFMP